MIIEIRYTIHNVPWYASYLSDYYRRWETELHKLHGQVQPVQPQDYTGLPEGYDLPTWEAALLAAHGG